MKQFIKTVKGRLAYIPIDEEAVTTYYIHYKEDVPVLLKKIEALQRTIAVLRAKKRQ